MDPNEALKKAREAAKTLDGIDMQGMRRVKDALEAAEQLTEAFQALDEWLSKGGFLPDDWRKGATPPTSGGILYTIDGVLHYRCSDGTLLTRKPDHDG